MTTLWRTFAWAGLLGLSLITGAAAPIESEDESLLASQLILAEEAPPLRSLRVLSVGFGEGKGRTREEAHAQVAQWIGALGDGAPAAGRRSLSFRSSGRGALPSTPA